MPSTGGRTVFQAELRGKGHETEPLSRLGLPGHTRVCRQICLNYGDGNRPAPHGVSRWLAPHASVNAGGRIDESAGGARRRARRRWIGRGRTEAAREADFDRQRRFFIDPADRGRPMQSLRVEVRRAGKRGAFRRTVLLSQASRECGRLVAPLGIALGLRPDDAAALPNAEAALHPAFDRLGQRQRNRRHRRPDEYQNQRAYRPPIRSSNVPLPRHTIHLIRNRSEIPCTIRRILHAYPPFGKAFFCNRLRSPKIRGSFNPKLASPRSSE